MSKEKKASKKVKQNKLRVKPVGDYIAVQILPNEMTTPGGIVLPETASGGITTARVLAVGTDARGSDLKEGDRVLLELGSFAKQEIEIDGSKIQFVGKDYVIAVLPD